MSRTVNLGTSSGTTVSVVLSGTSDLITINGYQYYITGKLTLNRSSNTDTSNWWWSGSNLTVNKYNNHSGPTVYITRIEWSYGGYNNTETTSSTSYSFDWGSGSNMKKFSVTYGGSCTFNIRLTYNSTNYLDTITVNFYNNISNITIKSYNTNAYYIAYQASNDYLNITWTSGNGFDKALSKFQLSFSSGYTSYITVTDTNGYLGTQQSFPYFASIKLTNKISGYGNGSFTASVTMYNSKGASIGSGSQSIAVYGNTRNESWSLSMTPSQIPSNMDVSISLSGTITPKSGTGSPANYFKLRVTGPTGIESKVTIKCGNTTINPNSTYAVSTYFTKSNTNISSTNPFTIKVTDNEKSITGFVILYTLYYNGTSIQNPKSIGVTVLNYKNVLTSTKTDLYYLVPNLCSNTERNSNYTTEEYSITSANNLNSSCNTSTIIGYPIGKPSSNTSSSSFLYSNSGKTTTIEYYFTNLANLNSDYEVNRMVVNIRATRQSSSVSSSSRAYIELDLSDTYDYGFDLDSTSSKLYTITVPGDELGDNDSLGVRFTVGEYGGKIHGIDITFYYINNSDSQIKGIVRYTNPNSCGLQKTQVWPPIYDVSLNSIHNDVYTVTTENSSNYYATTYESSSSGTIYGSVDSPINYSAESPNSSATNVIYASSGTTAVIKYRITGLSRMASTSYDGAYITCYVNAKAKSTTRDNTHFCRIALYSYYEDDMLSSSSSYITSTSFSKYTILSRTFFSEYDWDERYDIYKRGLYVGLGVANYGGIINGITVKIDYVTNNKLSQVYFPASIERYYGPSLNLDSYTYIRSGALKLTYGASNFQESNNNTTTNYVPTTYYSKTFGGTTYDALYYNGASSYILYLNNPSNYSNCKIPNEGYKKTSTTYQLAASSFGYYFCGYFGLPNTYCFGGGTGHTSATGDRNYTGINLLDWDSTSYLSKFRFKAINGTKGWYTTRKPIEWTAKFNGTSDTDYVNISTSNSNYSIAFVFVSTSSSIQLHEWGYGYASWDRGPADFNSSGFGGNYDWGTGGYPAPHYYLTNGSNLSSYNLKNLTGVSVGSNSSGTIKITFDLSSSSPSFLQKLVGSSTQINCAIHDSWADDQGWELGADPWYTSSSINKTYDYEHSSVQLYVYVMYYYNSGKTGYWGFEKNSSLYSIKWVPTKWEFETHYN